jgi:endonuclease/exonuclease/phosphatase family metal-dependent hydrolase
VSGAGTIKVLTVNTHKGFTHFNRRFILPELREAVRSVSADIVFLQEVHGAQHRHSRRFHNWPAAPQYEFLAETIWTDFRYGRNAVYPDGDHGNALLSKFPIVQHQNLDVSTAGAEGRGLLHCVLGVPAVGDVHAICVHLGLRETERDRQLHLLADLILGLPAGAPLIVAGDFNDWRKRASRVLAPALGLVEVFERLGGAPARSFPAFLPLLRLDRIYVRGLHVSRPEVLFRRPWSRLSDHVPLAVEVEVAAQAQAA